MLKVLVLKTDSPIIEVVELDKTLESKQAIVGGLIELVQLPNNIDLWCNEEGRLINLPLNVVLLNGRREMHIMGDVFFASSDDEGNMVSLSEEQIKWIEQNHQVAYVKENGNSEKKMLHVVQVD